MTTRPEILCAGRLYCDLVFSGTPRLPTFGTEVFARKLTAHPGGGAFITAAHLASLGRNAGLAAWLPVGAFRTLLEPSLAAAGLSYAASRDLPEGLDPQVTVVMTCETDRAFLSNRSGPAVPPLKARDLDGVRHLHIGELATLVECPWLIDAAKSAGSTISLDCSWDESITADVASLIARVDVFLPNQAEIDFLGSLGLAGPFAPLVVVKQGARGATAITATDSIHAATSPRIAVDTTGAGDAFNAGFLHGWLAQRPLAECLAHGNAQAGQAILTEGGFDLARSLVQKAAEA